jgi:hypothetical protein
VCSSSSLTTPPNIFLKPTDNLGIGEGRRLIGEG